MGGQLEVMDERWPLSFSADIHALVTGASPELLGVLDGMGNRQGKPISYSGGSEGSGFDITTFRVLKDRVPRFKQSLQTLADRLGAKVRVENEAWPLSQYARIQFSYRDASPAFEAAIKSMSRHFAP